MIEKFKNKKVRIIATTYGAVISNKYCEVKSGGAEYIVEGIVTNIDSNFIEIDSNIVIQIKYIVSIKNI